MLIVKSSHLTERETDDLIREGFALYTLRLPAVKVTERRPGSFVAHTVPIRLRRANLHLEIEELARLPLVRQEANRYLGRGWGVATYIYDRAVVGDGVPYPAHEDSFDGYKCMKVYAFLTDCDGKNGALRYENNPIYGPRGTLVLFDPTKTHGSGLIIEGSRYIARAHLVECQSHYMHGDGLLAIRDELRDIQNERQAAGVPPITLFGRLAAQRRG